MPVRVYDIESRSVTNLNDPISFSILVYLKLNDVFSFSFFFFFFFFFACVYPSRLKNWDNDMRRSRVVRAAWLWCRKSPEGREFVAGLHHPTT